MPIGPATSGAPRLRLRWQPEVKHKVRMRDFESWLESAGRTPAEMSLKTRLRELLGR